MGLCYEVAAQKYKIARWLLVENYIGYPSLCCADNKLKISPVAEIDIDGGG